MEIADMCLGLIIFVAILGGLGVWFIYVDSRNDTLPPREHG